VGFPAIDLIVDGAYAPPEDLTNRLGLDPQRPVVLFTQHSVTTEFKEVAVQLRPSLEAMTRLANQGIQVILTYPNNDAGGEAITSILQGFVGASHPNIQLHRSLGRSTYHGLLALAKLSDWRIACVGNSSSGIKETPVFGCPTVNIGTRQQGRLRGDNVIDVDYHAELIYTASHRCLFDEKFRSLCAGTKNPYGGGNAGKLIAASLATADLSPISILRKRMMLAGERKDNWFS